MNLPETMLAAAATNGAIRAGLLVFMDFVDEPMWAWLGNFDLTTTDGRIWKGIGDVVSVEGGGQSLGMVAPSMSFTIAATEEMLALAKESRNRVYGRRIRVAIQFFDEDWQTLDQPQVWFSGVMDHMRIKFAQGGQHLITLLAESPFVRRKTPRILPLTDAAQKERYPGDRGLEFVAGLKDKTVNWPVFT